MILGQTLTKGLAPHEQHNFILFPLLIHSFDLVVSSIGVLSVCNGNSNGNGSTKKRDMESLTGDNAGDLEDPMMLLKKGYLVALALGSVAVAISSATLLHVTEYPDAWWRFMLCGQVGIVNAIAFLQLAQYYTDYQYYPVQSIAKASLTGGATNVIAGIGVGMQSTALPVVCIVISILTTYHLGESAMPGGGLFGTSVATMGMLSSAVYVLAMDIFGPIADNAGGIVEMSDQPDSVRDITDRLDAVGNTTKAATKGYSIGSAGLACFLLFSAFMDVISGTVKEKDPSAAMFTTVDFSKPEVFCGGLLGGMLVFLFSSMSINSVGVTAHVVVREVRRQFNDHPGIMDYQEKPDYQACVSIVAKAALEQMRMPGLLAIFMPVGVGMLFRFIGGIQGNSLLGPEVCAGFLMSATIVGILMALFLNNAGGAWDNAKKYVEMGVHGGKGSETHKATVTGDTVGDPFKDTAGPSIHVLIKLLSTITLVAGPLFIAPKS